MTRIPEAAVTAAWIEADLPDEVTKDVARRILEAAAPHMLEGAWDAGAEAMERSTWPDGDMPDNPYRTAK